jgi:hypothetical protein
MSRFIAVSFAGALAGCVHTNAAVLNPTAVFARTCPAAVVAYTTPDRVPGRYTEIALLNSSGSSRRTSEAGMIQSQREKASELGANGIILEGIDEPSAGAKVAGAFLGTRVERKGKALAIWVEADSAKTRGVCMLWR